jgi:1-acyl-sn-glycerol-3-phosphate acyltransferase
MRDRSGHPGQSLFLSTLFNVVGGLLYSLRFQVRITSEHLIPPTGPVLVLAKHWSLADVPLGKIAITKDSGRHLWCVMKESLARGPFGWFLLRQGGIPINRQNPEKSKHDLLLARRVLNEGHVLCLFPEQTIVPGKMGRGRLPGFRFVTNKPEQPIPVLCVGFHYHKRKYRRTLVEVNIGAPRMMTAEDDPAEFLQERMHEIARLSGLEYRGAVVEAEAK